MLSDELFFKAELNKKIGLKTSKKGPGAHVIDIFFSQRNFISKTFTISIARVRIPLMLFYDVLSMIIGKDA
jgi:hypothetical protein